MIPVVAWFAGLALLYSSEMWSRRDKVIGTLLLPGGLATPFILGVFAVPAGSCEGVVESGRATFVETCTGSGLPPWLGGALLLILVLTPLATTVYLGLRLRRRPAPEAG